jgi:hypothetical protein
MVTHPLPRQQPLHAVPVVVEAVPGAVLHPQPQPTVLWHLLFLQQQADAVAEVELLLQQPQWKLFRRLPKAHWRRRCRKYPVLESSGPRKARATPSNTPIEFHLRMEESALFLRRIGAWEIGVINGGSQPELPHRQTSRSPYSNFA